MIDPIEEQEQCAKLAGCATWRGERMADMDRIALLKALIEVIDECEDVKAEAHWAMDW